ncbi:rhomboid family intramembrane serine protease [Parabacteroides sp. PF5-9]|uniref:rhomboid family intramembrane serine protease n=1 Tax=Parabacteroides sp. PF5-9 TaxID=1742404 RepID=UPI002475B6AE|nr:rhomboid family intramembrane serine protease [Parabacteroides sp. PF5-9]MDH6359206.1 membrane associated rhomboid family serine protease [Parabacteroides sp. PF5-9]
MMNQNSGGFLSSIPPVTKNLIIINLLFWVATLALPKVGINLIELLGLHFPGATDFKFYQIISYMFMHDTRSFTHVFFNMFAVYMFGRVLENVWGPKRFLTFYFVTGIGAGLMQELVWFFELREVLAGSYEMINLNGVELITKSEYLNFFVTVGASGAVFGILMAFGVMFPNIPLYVMFIPVPIKAKYFVIGYGLIELFMGVANFQGDSVAHFAHLGGMLFGYILLRYWKKKDGRYFF